MTATSILTGQVAVPSNHRLTGLHVPAVVAMNAAFNPVGATMKAGGLLLAAACAIAVEAAGVMTAAEVLPVAVEEEAADGVVEANFRHLITP